MLRNDSTFFQIHFSILFLVFLNFENVISNRLRSETTNSATIS